MFGRYILATSCAPRSTIHSHHAKVAFEADDHAADAGACRYLAPPSIATEPLSLHSASFAALIASLLPTPPSPNSTRPAPPATARAAP